MDHANAIPVDAAVADFTARTVRVLRALWFVRHCAGGATANHTDAGGIDTGTRPSDGGKQQPCPNR
jgi:hypothetical protein